MTVTMATTVTMEIKLLTYTTIDAVRTLDNTSSYRAQPLTCGVHPKAQN